MTSCLLGIGLVLLGNLSNALPTSASPADQPVLEGNAAQRQDIDGASGGANSQTLQEQVSTNSIGRVDEIGSDIRLASSILTVLIVVFTLGVVGYVSFNPVPSDRNSLPRTEPGVGNQP